MSISQDLSFRRPLPLITFEQLRQLLQQMAQAQGNQAKVLTEANLAPIASPIDQQLDQFTVVVSRRFSALLIGTLTNHLSNSSAEYHSVLNPESLVLNTSLTFDPDAIALFLSQLSDLLQHNPQAQATLARYRQFVQPNDVRLQSEFTLLLLSTLVPEPKPESEASTTYSYVSVCQPVEQALHQQIAQERLINQVTTQIRQSLDLSVILVAIIE